MAKKTISKKRVPKVVDVIVNEAPEVSSDISEAKETRRKFLLDLQATLDRERIHSLSDIEFKLAELDRQ
jgi:hypothetical protein